MAPQAVSDYRRKKFNSYIKFLDAQNNGFICRENYEVVAKNMSQLSNASPAEARDLSKVLMGWWEMYRAGKEGVTQVPTADVVQRIVEFVSTMDPDKAVENTRVTHEKIFDLTDQSKEGVISPKALKIYYNAYGVQDEDFINDVFKKIDVRGKGVISRAEFVDAHVAFWYSDDPENGCHFLFEIPK